MRAVWLDIPQYLLDQRRAWGGDRRDEMWDGVLHMPPMPTVWHQDLVGDLMFFLHERWMPETGGHALRGVGVARADEPDWLQNYRVPDFVAMTGAHSDACPESHVAGPPLVVGEVHESPEETYERMPFFAALGVPEVWVFDARTHEPTLFELAGGDYVARPYESGGWLRSPVTGAAFRRAADSTLEMRLGDEPPAEMMSRRRARRRSTPPTPIRSEGS